jgi:hypothetical protein
MAQAIGARCHFINMWAIFHGLRGIKNAIARDKGMSRAIVGLFYLSGYGCFFMAQQ